MLSKGNRLHLNYQAFNAKSLHLVATIFVQCYIARMILLGGPNRPFLSFLISTRLFSVTDQTIHCQEMLIDTISRGL